MQSRIITAKLSSPAVMGFIALLLVSPCINASYLDEPPTINAIGTIGDDSDFVARVESRGDSETWRGDTFNLVVVDAQSRKTLKLPFDAAYGLFRLYVDKLDGGSNPDFILLTARGEGSGATSYYLDIYRIENDKIVKSYEKLVADHFGVSAMWRYDVCFVALNQSNQALDLHLSLEIDHSSDHDDKTLIPSAKSLRVHWDEKSAKFFEDAINSGRGC